MAKVKSSPEEKYRYMTWGEYIDYETKEAKEEARATGLAEGRAKGRAEGRAEGLCMARQEDIIESLGELGDLPDAIIQKINATTDIEQLKKWHKMAIKANSISAFEAEM